MPTLIHTLLVFSFVYICGASLMQQWPAKWLPARRSSYCGKTGQACIQTSQCCSLSDVCLSPEKDKKSSIATCQDMTKLARFANPYKYAGETCSDSLECLDLCCRVVRGHRFRGYICGKPEDRWISYSCLRGRRSENDVIDSVGFGRKVYNNFK